MKAALVVLGAGVLLAGAGTWGWLGAGKEVTVQPDAVDLADGAALYESHCATCHGAELEGQADWQAAAGDGPPPAPPHDETGHTWHHGDGLLFTYTKLGGAETLARRGIAFDSGMPGFGDRLSDREIRTILAFIKSTWPEHVRDVQAERTEAERATADD